MYLSTLLFVATAVCSSDAFLVTPSRLRHRGRSSLSSDGGSFIAQGKERIESVKAAVVSTLAGSLANAPFSVFGGLIFDGGRLTPTWEFNNDALALQLFLFGVVYRYAVRTDENPNLKQGVVGAFAVSRVLNQIRIDDTICSSLPLNCGAPFGYVSWSMIQQALLAGLPSLLAFGISAYVLDSSFKRGLVAPLK